jgi:hypothetical protein
LTDFGMSIQNYDEKLFVKEKSELSHLLDCYMWLILISNIS